MAGPISISVVADVAKMRQGIDEVNGRLGGMGKAVSGVAKAFVGAAIVKAAWDMGKAVVKSASDSQQSLGATETVFGHYAKTVVGTSKQAAQEFGLSANQYRENANLLGALFKNQGVATDQLAAKTKSFVGVGADLAATYGGTTKDAVEALGSAFKGEFDPLERYGISIKQSAINAELAAKGQDKLTGAALKQAQQQATTALIMRQSKDAMGAFARESDTLAGQQQRLGAQWEDIKAKVGTALLPVLTSLASTFNSVVLPAISTAWTFLSTKLGPAFDVVKGYVQRLAATFGGGGGGGLSGAVKGVQDTFAKVVAVVGPIVLQVVNLVRDNWGKIVTFVKTTLAKVVSIWRDELTLARTVVDVALKIIKALWERFGADALRIVRTLFSTIAGVIKGALNIVQGIIRLFTSVLKGDWSGAWKAVQQILRGAWQVITSIIKGAVGIARTTVSAGFRLLADGVKAGIGLAVDFVRGLPGKIKSALGNLGSLLVSAGRDLIQGLINGITAMAGAAIAKVKSLAGSVISAAKGAFKIHSPSKVFHEIGQFVGKGFVQGLGSTRDEIISTMDRLATLVKEYGGKATKAAYDAARPHIVALGGEYDRLKTKLDDLSAAYKQYADNVSQAVVETGNVTGFKDGETGATTFQGIVQGMTQARDQAREWKQALTQLAALGLNKTSLDQIASKGPTDGLAAAQAIVEAGKAGVAQINALQGQIAGLAAKAGKTAADALLAQGKNTGSAIIKGLQQGIRNIESEMEATAGRIADKIRHAMAVDLPKLQAAEKKDDGTEKVVKAVEGVAKAVKDLPAKQQQQTRKDRK